MVDNKKDLNIKLEGIISILNDDEKQLLSEKIPIGYFHKNDIFVCSGLLSNKCNCNYDENFNPYCSNYAPVKMGENNELFYGPFHPSLMDNPSFHLFYDNEKIDLYNARGRLLKKYDLPHDFELKKL
jgi:hypothetical protein